MIFLQKSKFSQNSQENIRAWVSFLIKLHADFIKNEAPTQVFFCEFCEIFKNTLTPLDDCFCHIRVLRESTLYYYLNIEELLRRNLLACIIQNLSNCNGIRSHNHLVRKRTLGHLNDWVFVYGLSGCGFKSRFSHLNSTFYWRVFSNF